jgi:sec-independent protein translocase protein TatB
MLQGGEILIILILALIVLGPTRLPDMARRLGRWTAELRSAAREITRGLEAEVSDLKTVRDELKAPLDELRREVRSADPRRYEWKGPKPVSGPTPEDALADLERIERPPSDGDGE